MRRVLIAAALVAALAGSLVPSRFSGYAARLGDMVNFALAPLSHPLHYASASLRGQFDPPPEDARVLLTRWENAQETAASIIRLQEQVNRLRMENRMLRNMREQLRDRTGRYRFPTAGVIARAADPGSTILQLNRGRKDGLGDGVPAVDGANLVGRISRARRLTASLQLVTAPDIRLDVIITPKLAPLSELVAVDSPLCQLDVVDHDRFSATVPVDAPVGIGDYARLVDADWPDSVQGMIVGKVTAVEPLPDDPLTWKFMTVEPRVNLRYLRSVTLIVPQRGDED